ncbi:uncharacterized protein LOC109725923 [Ananas comosus]|uniref:Uncharacterized protein LOC109725923 n=1 Tax=Ananas comosus TaxID=4615 RepID=A0A6P5GSW3_ANACO|nr:uncharacterized protein LOC109725923 [Ananas comosus]
MELKCKLVYLPKNKYLTLEGTTHDTRIFLRALRTPELKFPLPPLGKYYLVDAGYPQIRGFLRPYKNQRYHLPDFRRGGQPLGLQEVFNRTHSSLRSVRPQIVLYMRYNRAKLLTRLKHFGWWQGPRG